MEELLNKLIEKGWNVFPDKKFFGNKDKLRFSKGKKCVWFGNDDYSLRELVSKDSGLWQFVCENKMVEYIDCAYCKYIQNDEEIWYETQSNDYRYRLIESALKDESELEDFLLSNIKVDE